MKIHLQKAIFINRAPFDNIELDFDENEIAILSAVNGKGKTTILSHIVDAFYEIAKPHFHNEFEGKENKFYRVSSSIYNLDNSKPSFVYIRFDIDGEKIDYVDIRNTCTELDYNSAISLNDKIPFNQIDIILKNSSGVKKVSENMDKTKTVNVFESNLLTYFPAYRFEMPGYLNAPYKVKLDFKKDSGFNGFMNNPIEVISGLPQLANWLMDIVIDMQYTQSAVRALKSNLDLIISLSVISRKFIPLRLGVGPRGYGNTRIQIINSQTGEPVYPSIFNLSSGEAAIICLFGELLRQADNYKNDISLSEITGIVLIDEVDKHLHIRLQKEVLPSLFNLFPNVQFIISSHSPFLSMGLAEVAKERSRILDLDNLGIATNAISNPLYTEVYNMMINENERFKELYTSIEKEISNNSIPLIITEGKTDIQHIKKAKEILGFTDFEFDYFNAESDSKLKSMIEQLSKISQTRKIIAIYDRDVPAVISEIEKDGQPYKSYGNNVYAFCIPPPTNRSDYKNISIEFYYTDEQLKTQKDGKSLYFDNELNFDSKRKPISPIPNPTDNFEKKIWCENIGDLSWIHSKSRFAILVESDPQFINDFDFENFTLIFDKIKEILFITQSS